MPDREIDPKEAELQERTAGVITFEQAREALIRTYAGTGELWYNYHVPRSEQREVMEGDWLEFLRHLEDVLDGKPDQGPDDA